MALHTRIALVPSAPRTTSGNASNRLTHGNLVVLPIVTAVSGTSPTLGITVEWSTTGTTWVTADPPDTFTQLTAVGGAAKFFVAKGVYYRVVWTIGGSSPSFTFSIDTMHVE